MDDMNMGDKKVCNCPHHKIMPVIIILIGLTFLLGAFNVLSPMAVSIIWPILVIIIGLKKLKRCKCCMRG
jgi:hypothetical protein